MDPALHSPTGDAFRSDAGSGGNQLHAAQLGDGALPWARWPRWPAQFDQVAILSARSPHKESAVLGPVRRGRIQAGRLRAAAPQSELLEARRQWTALPYLDSIRLDIQQNRELELLRFRRGELDIVNKLDPEMYDRLASEMPHSVVDAGPSLDWEVVFFNQVASAPLPDYKRRWFRSDDFRRAISDAINRDDHCARRLSRACPSRPSGPVSVANHFWLNPALKPPAYSAAAALDACCERARFPALWRFAWSISDGHKVEFSMITNAGNKTARADAGADPAGSGASWACSSMSSRSTSLP